MSLNEAVLELFSHFADKQMVLPWQQAAVLATHLYNYSMTCLQMHSLLRNRSHWAADLAAQMAAMPTQVRDWIQNPANDELLLGAVVACYEQQVMTQASAPIVTDHPLGF